MYNYSLQADKTKRRAQDKIKLEALLDKHHQILSIKQMIMFAEENALTLPDVEELYNEIKKEQKQQKQSK